MKWSLGGPLSKLCVTLPFSINFRCQIENQVSDYRLLGASSFYSIMKFFQNYVLLSYKGYYIFLLQFKRLKECEKMLVAVEMAGWLNEANLALQAVVQCYGLLAPLIFYKIPSVAVIQVFFICWHARIKI